MPPLTARAAQPQRVAIAGVVHLIGKCVHELNQHIFLLLNASDQPPGLMRLFAVVLANGPAIVGPVLLIVLWVWGVPSRRGALVAVAGTLLIGQGINQVLGMIHYEPRPFMVPVGHTLIDHVADNSFPSDHATFIWTLGVGLVLSAAAPRSGRIIILYGGAVAWSRVYLGVHFPDDMAVSLLVALLCGGVARAITPIVDAWVLPSLDIFYESVLCALRLPSGIFPRKSQS